MTAVHPTVNKMLAKAGAQAHTKTMGSSIAFDATNVPNYKKASLNEISFGGKHILNTNSVQSES